MSWHEAICWATIMLLNLGASIYLYVRLAQFPYPGDGQVTVSDAVWLYEDTRMVVACTGGAFGGSAAAFLFSLHEALLVRMANILASFLGGFFLSPALIRISGVESIGDYAMFISFVVALSFVGGVYGAKSYFSKHSDDVIGKVVGTVFGWIQNVVSALVLQKRKDE